MKNVVVSALAAASLAACIQPKDEPHPVARAIPTAQQVAINLPDRDPRTIGELAPWYLATRDITRTLNGGTAWVLILVHTIVQFPPTSSEGETYTWGPWSDSLDPAEYKLDVTQAADGSYDWELSGRSKTEQGATFEVVISGNAVPSVPEGHGHGSLFLDFDAGKRVNPVDADPDARGTLAVNYDIAARHLDMGYDTVEDRNGVMTPASYDYNYDEADDGAGNMVFALHADTEDEGTLAEDVTVRSRWQSDGAGRSDAEARNGDMGSAVGTVSQCWNTNFHNVYTTYVFGQAIATEGAASDCVYASASMPQ